MHTSTLTYKQTNRRRCVRTDRKECEKCRSDFRTGLLEWGRAGESDRQFHKTPPPLPQSGLGAEHTFLRWRECCQEMPVCACHAAGRHDCPHSRRMPVSVYDASQHHRRTGSAACVAEEGLDAPSRSRSRECQHPLGAWGQVGRGGWAGRRLFATAIGCAPQIPGHLGTMAIIGEGGNHIISAARAKVAASLDTEATSIVMTTSRRDRRGNWNR
ncbi:unnamed protein product, partial [Protopolystoma xenopodis]